MGRRIGEKNVFSIRRYNLVRLRVENIQVGELVEMEGIKRKNRHRGANRHLDY